MPRTPRIETAHGMRLALTFALAGAMACVGCTTSGDAGNGTGNADAGGADGGGVVEPDARGTLPPADAAADVDSADGAEGGEGGGPVSSPECVTYCKTIQGACAVDYPQFGTMSACLNACALYPPGPPGDQSGAGNTLTCRQQHATSSLSGTYHCFHGGPYGYGGCGSMCEGFCQIAMGWCAASAGGAPFASAAACTTECEGWAWAPAGPDGLAAFRADGPSTGNTLDCREAQLIKSLESSANRDAYCPRAASDSSTCR